MLVKLDRVGLEDLVKGTSPSYSLITEYEERKLGRYYDNNGWSWNLDKNLQDYELLAIYWECRESWKK